MPRRLLREGRIVEDHWVYAAEGADDPAAPLIVPFEQWQAERDRWLARSGPLGVILSPAHKVEQLARDLARLTLVGSDFTGPSEGRGYTQARQLREQYKFAGEVRATGYVHRDQLFFMARCGFNSFELRDGEAEDAWRALSTFSAAYQPSNDAGLPLKLQRR